MNVELQVKTLFIILNEKNMLCKNCSHWCRASDSKKSLYRFFGYCDYLNRLDLIKTNDFIDIKDHIFYENFSCMYYEPKKED